MENFEIQNCNISRNKKTILKIKNQQFGNKTLNRFPHQKLIFENQTSKILKLRIENFGIKNKKFRN